jgi:SAM-dependent methyltransferase
LGVLAFGAMLKLRFDSYERLKQYVWQSYKPLPEELAGATEGFAPGTSWAHRHLPRFYRAIRFFAQSLPEGARIIEVGAYPGSFARLLKIASRSPLDLTCVGHSVTSSFQNALAAEGIHFKECEIDPHLAKSAAAAGLPIDSESVDVICCMEVVEHLYSLRLLFEECRRVLKPGGLLYVTTNNVLDRNGLIRARSARETNLDVDLSQTTIWASPGDSYRQHVRFYSMNQLRAVGELAGLITEHCRGFDVYEDSSVYVWPTTLFDPVRKALRGDGSRAPFRLRTVLGTWWHLGLAGFSRDFDDHIEIIYRKKTS